LTKTNYMKNLYPT